jgi:hypothetical protein
MNRLRSAAVLLAFLGASSVGLAACGGAATSQARDACKKIDHSIALFDKATTPPIPTNAPELKTQAQALLLEALPIAARATSGDGSFNALMTTLSEATRVPERLLVPALRRQCKVIESNTPYLAQ